MDINEKIKLFVSNNLTISDAREIGNDDDIFELGFVNSMFAMKLLTYVESEFSIRVEIDEMELSNFSTLDNIVNFVSKKLETV